MSTHDTPRDCPDWFCQPARCRCGDAEWQADCEHLTLPAGAVLGDN